jgi:outer membrane receptor protein involved in Fe transport
MGNRLLVAAIVAMLCLLAPLDGLAGVEGAISGSATDSQGVAIPNAQVQLLGPDGKILKETTTSPTGEFQFFPVTFGDYDVKIQAVGLPTYQSTVHVASGSTSRVDAQISPQTKEMVMEVKAKKHLIHHSAAVSSTEVSQKQIEQLPQGNEISLPKLLTTTTPGTVPGPFGQVFFRGNHANIQYQIDGVQLPDSPSNTFGQAFSPRNIDHMEVITGGIPAEYGERLAAVVNIVTKTGPETPGGEATIGYGTFKTLSPQVLYGGSSADGSVHYFLSGGYTRTDRGLDTPQPASVTDQKHGGTDPNHDYANNDSQFAKIDWLASNTNKLSLIAFNARNYYQVPNYPSSFRPTDAIFQPGNTDPFGNNSDPTAGPSLNFVPFNTDDWQRERNFYTQVVWKHTFTESSFLQLAPYYKFSSIFVHNDKFNDLATSNSGALSGVIPNASPSSFAEDRKVNNYGLKGDFTTRPDERNLVKAGFQVQTSRADGNISVQTDLATLPSLDNNTTKGTFESVYAQDDFTILKSLVLNAGLRFDATQFSFSGLSPKDSLVQPRVGLNYMATDTTKLHIFYGKLFQPAPAENLRDTFVNTGAGQLTPYDIKAEKDDYYEVGVTQQVFDTHVVSVTGYYKDATNMLDDAQLLNTSIAQPYNFARGYAKGIEVSVKGQIADDWTDYANYTYEIAKGKGISGGIFAFPAGTATNSGWQFLDHVQLQTANAGIGYAKNHFSATLEGLFGSGLRTGPNNTGHLPPHFTMDTTLGYEFKGDTWWSRWKASFDVLNIFDNAYPITLANGFNGSHYAPGRQFFVRLTKDL